MVYFGLHLYKSSGSITDLTLDNNYYGINYYQSTMPSLQNSSVTNSHYYGMYVNGVSPDFDIINNTFSNNQYGLYLYNYAGLIRDNTVSFYATLYQECGARERMEKWNIKRD
ncbi:MAG: right-handed parallel beta-helix repeat-containing protein [Candidatus Marinimicrobia bacterium]|nr:right-handed parallel beta-helix repeat-containing protein [Candidatus Neomarinimicrobiota bacterium]